MSYNLTDIKNINQDLQDFLKSNGIESLPEKILNNFSKPFFTYYESDWYDSATARGYTHALNTEASGIFNFGSIFAGILLKLNLPHYLIPYSKVSFVTSQNPIAKTVGVHEYIDRVTYPDWVRFYGDGTLLFSGTRIQGTLEYPTYYGDPSTFTNNTDFIEDVLNATPKTYIRYSKNAYKIDALVTGGVLKTRIYAFRNVYSETSSLRSTFIGVVYPNFDSFEFRDTPGDDNYCNGEILEVGGTYLEGTTITMIGTDIQEELVSPFTVTYTHNVIRTYNLVDMEFMTEAFLDDWIAFDDETHFLGRSPFKSGEKLAFWDSNKRWLLTSNNFSYNQVSHVFSKSTRNTPFKNTGQTITIPYSNIQIELNPSPMPRLKRRFFNYSNTSYDLRRDPNLNGYSPSDEIYLNFNYYDDIKIVYKGLATGIETTTGSNTAIGTFTINGTNTGFSNTITASSFSKVYTKKYYIESVPIKFKFRIDINNPFYFLLEQKAERNASS